MKAETKKNSKKKSMPILVAPDIGFGETKLISSAFPTPIVIPSAVVAGAKASSSKLFNLHTIDEDRLVVTTEDGTYFVGEQAMRMPTDGSKRTQVRDRANDPSSRVLFRTGIALSVPHEEGEYDVFVVTGLPNDDYELSIRDELEEFLNRSFEVTFHLSNEVSITKKINIVGCDILRQPEGSVTYNQFAFDHTQTPFLVASQNARTMVGIIDFGHFTTDYALFENGIIIESDVVSGSTVGVTEAYKMLRTKLTSKFDKMGYEYRATDKDLDKAVRTGSIFYMGEDVSVKEEVEEVARAVARTIAKAVLDAWGNETNRLELIVVSGGGSHIFSEYLNEEFQMRKKQGFQVLESPQFSNVLGFYMYGCIVLGQQYQQDQIFKEYIDPVFAEVV